MPSAALSCGRKVSVGAKTKAARTRLRIQIPILPNRRRSAGNSRRRRGRHNSHRETPSRLPRSTIAVSDTSSCARLGLRCPPLVRTVPLPQAEAHYSRYPPVRLGGWRDPQARGPRQSLVSATLRTCRDWWRAGRRWWNRRGDERFATIRDHKERPDSAVPDGIWSVAVVRKTGAESECSRWRIAGALGVSWTRRRRVRSQSNGRPWPQNAGVGRW